MRQCFLFTVFLLWSTSQAFAAACPQADEPNVIVTTDTGPIQYDRSKSVSQLSQLSNEPTEGRTIGRTSPKVDFTYAVGTAISTFPDGTVCAALTNLTIQLRHSITTVYIAREIPAGSCLDREVRIHENRHVTVNNVLLSEYQNHISRELRPSLRNIGAIRASNEDVATEALSRRIETLFSPIFKKMDAERLRRQNQIDTPQEYERAARVCNGEAQRYIHHR